MKEERERRDRREGDYIDNNNNTIVIIIVYIISLPPSLPSLSPPLSYILRVLFTAVIPSHTQPLNNLEYNVEGEESQ